VLPDACDDATVRRAFACADRSALVDLPHALASFELYAIDRWVERYAAAHAGAIWDSLGLPTGELDLGAAELARRAGVADGRWPMFDALVRQLRARGLCDATVCDPVMDPLDRILRVRAAPELAPLRMRAAEVEVGPTRALMDHVAVGYADVVRGRTTGAQLLGDRVALALWHDYFAPTNPGYHAANVLAAELARRVLPAEGALRALELGAGAGSGTIALLAAFADRDVDLVATDRSAALLDLARERVAATPKVARVALRRLDFDREFPPDLGTFDLVFAANALHAARELTGALAAVRALLAPSGVLVLAEAVRLGPTDELPQALVFALAPEFARSPRAAPPHRHGFLARDEWRAALGAAGYAPPVELPDPVALAGSGLEFRLSAMAARPL